MNRSQLLFNISICLACFSSAISQTGWEQQESGTSNHLNDVCFVNVDTGWAVGSNGTILNTINGGESWVYQASSTNSSLSALHFVNSMKGWVVGDDGAYLYTTNGGDTWNSLFISSNSMVDIFFINDSTGWICAEGNPSIYKTTDCGLTWFCPNSNPQFFSGHAIQFINESIGWIDGIGRPAKVYKTMDGGVSWIGVSCTNSIHSLFFIDETYGWAGGATPPIARTTDGGMSWVELNNDPFGGRIHDIFFIDRDTGWFVGDTGKIRRTDNGGDSWEFQDTPTEDMLSAVQFVNSSIGYAVGWKGTILKTTSGGNITANTDREVNVPLINTLQQNYPNPFNPKTTIKYNLYKSSNVILNIYNLAGQEIETLVNSYQIAGEHVINWRPIGLPSGIYFYRLQAGDFSATKKLILQK